MHTVPYCFGALFWSGILVSCGAAVPRNGELRGDSFLPLSADDRKGWHEAQIVPSQLFVSTCWYQDNYVHVTGDGVTVEVNGAVDGLMEWSVFASGAQAGTVVKLQLEIADGEIAKGRVAAQPFSDRRRVNQRGPLAPLEVVDAKIAYDPAPLWSNGTARLLFYVRTETVGHPPVYLFGQIDVQI